MRERGYAIGSVRLSSVCPVKKNCNLEIYRVKRLLILTITLKIFKKIGTCVPNRDQSGSILPISSFFLFNIDIVYHFNMVNHLDTAEAGHTRALDMCSCDRIRREASVSLIRVFALQRCRVQPINQLEKLHTPGTPVTRARC